MSAEDEATKLLSALEDDGFEIGSCCVVPQGVTFSSKQLAKTFAKMHDKELVPIEGPVSGCLAKNRSSYRCAPLELLKLRQVSDVEP